jgi:NADPH-dependent 2,4-dienoyl-CoA reductase/sulfur reductase-like enzyme
VRSATSRAGVKRNVPDIPPVLSVGRVTTPELAEEILASGDADIVGMTRAHIADPYLLHKAAEGRRNEIRLCIGCNQGCIGGIGTGGPLACLQNPVVGHESSFGGEWPSPAANPSRVVVVGGGPAGMEAAWVAGARGHRVTLIEQTDFLGGQVRLYSGVESRSEFRGVIDFRWRMLEKFGVDVRTQQSLDSRLLAELRPEHLLLATGCSAFIPPQFESGGDAITAIEAMTRPPQHGRWILIVDVEGNAQAITS